MTEVTLEYALTFLADMTALTDPAASLAQAAAYYAGLGWPVFPLLPGDKRPLLASAHPAGDPLRGFCTGECGQLGHGLNDATADAGQVASWWEQTPLANIGLRTGVAFDAIDVDTKNGKDGVASFWAIAQQTGALPTLLGSTLTTTGGRHLLVAPTGKGNLADIAPGLDYRGTGGYIVAPPSVIADRAYTWVVAPVAELLGAAA